MTITFSTQKNFDADQLYALYNSVGWTAYTKDISSLQAGLTNSDLVISAWMDSKLIGLVRALTDGQTIAYIQDILVRPEYHKQGLGSQLMRQILAMLEGIRQIVLMTDSGEENAPLHDWYRSFGFKSYNDLGTIGFAIFDDGEAEANL
ncbi:MAG: GNAT family N-acetyltransferase [Anaerolineaceae bacterium]